MRVAPGRVPVAGGVGNMKLIATGMLVAMAALFLLSRGLEAGSPGWGFVRAFAEAEDLPFDLLSDHWPHGAIAREYGVFDDEAGCALRGSFLLDRSGTITWQVLNGIGEPRDIVAHLQNALQSS